MKININELRAKNQSNFINQVILEKVKDVDFELLEPVRVDYEISFIGEEIYIRGKFKTKIKTACVKCLSSYEMNLEGEIEGHYLDSKSFNEYSNSLEGEIESDMIAYEAIIEDEIDLEKLVREHLILEIDPFGLCNDECAGLDEMSDYADDGIDPRWMDLLEMSKKKINK